MKDKISLDFISPAIKLDSTFHNRLVVRAIIYDENGLIYMHLVERDDIFGKLSYLETPGGGVEKDESLSEAIKREVKEELGIEIEIIDYLGCVFDSYNLIKQRNEVHFFLAKKTKDTHFIERVSQGDQLIAQSLHLPLNKIIEEHESWKDDALLNVVKKRELPFFYYLKNKKLASSDE